MKRVEGVVWRPIAEAPQYCRPGSAQIVVLYRPQQDHAECYLEYMTSNPDYAAGPHAANNGVTEFAVLVDV